MKKIIVLIFIIAGTITIHSCRPLMYYACCDTGHASWKGREFSSEASAYREAVDHDSFTHGGVYTANVCHN